MRGKLSAVNEFQLRERRLYRSRSEVFKENFVTWLWIADFEAAESSFIRPVGSNHNATGINAIRSSEFSISTVNAFRSQSTTESTTMNAIDRKEWPYQTSANRRNYASRLWVVFSGALRATGC
ncbi:MAG: hypothetical protein CMJ64_14320 [Planctomycetaceae bacterium]|nr:hypothetical protein [Planctomycetaceae bacterium]